MSTTTAPRREYSEAERDQALAIFALEAGREKAVAAVLSELAMPAIPIATLRSWAYDRHKDRYERIKNEVEVHARSQLADRARGFALLGGEVVEEGLRQLQAKLESGEIKPKELPKVVHEAAVAFGIGVDKGELLSGRPTSRVAAGDFSGLLDELKGLGVDFIDGEAIEEDGADLSQPLEEPEPVPAWEPDPVPLMLEAGDKPD